MTKERQTAIDIWRRIHDRIADGEDVLICLEKYRESARAGYAWTNNCWLCQYAGGCDGCPLAALSAPCRYAKSGTAYDVAVNSSQTREERLYAIETILDGLHGSPAQKVAHYALYALARGLRMTDGKGGAFRVPVPVSLARICASSAASVAVAAYLTDAGEECRCGAERITVRGTMRIAEDDAPVSFGKGARYWHLSMSAFGIEGEADCLPYALYAADAVRDFLSRVFMERHIDSLSALNAYLGILRSGAIN